MQRARTILIIGGGASGTVLAAQLLRRAREGSVPLHLSLIERDEIPHRGKAYGTTSPSHLLNVPAGKMSALPDQPHHFLEWLHSEGEPYDERAFVPRRLYGRYIENLLRREVDTLPKHLSFTVIRGDVAKVLNADEQGVVLELSDGRIERADKVVLATGNFEPSPPTRKDDPFYTSNRYLNDPWKPKVLDQIAPDAPVLLVGTGLTMVDLLLTLRDRHHTGPIVALSRRGLLPQSHRPFPPHSPYIRKAGECPSVREGLARFKREMTEHGLDWRQAIDALRSDTIPLWQGLPLKEKRRFLRHLKPYWEVHRHRIAGEVHDVVMQFIENKQLQIVAGRIARYTETDNGVEIRFRKRRGGEATLTAQYVVNCTGPDLHLAGLNEPFIADLLNKGFIRPAPLSLGFDATPEGALIGEDGVPSERFLTLGPPLKGVLWESTAMPEIRVQADVLAKKLVKEL